MSEGKLRIALKPGTGVSTGTLQADLTARSLSGISLSGAASVRLAGDLSGQRLEATSSGAGRLEGTIRVQEAKLSLSGASRAKLAGDAARALVEESGASDLDAAQLKTGDLDIHLSGASSATAQVSRTIVADLSGASRLRYSGSPQFVRRQTSGGSTITQE